MVNAVKEVADFVGDVVRPVADAAADVLRPVGEAILRSDEVKTVVNVAAVATGNAWAVPIINGADAIDEGADPEDVLKTIVVSIVAAGAADFSVFSIEDKLLTLFPVFIYELFSPR